MSKHTIASARCCLKREDSEQVAVIRTNASHRGKLQLDLDYNSITRTRQRCVSDDDVMEAKPTYRQS